MTDNPAVDVDPTAFAIAFDPRTRRMSGRAVHGNTYFDVPFVSEIAENLWTGGCERGLVLPEIFRHVVSLYPWERYTIRHEGVRRTEVRMFDDLVGPDRAQVLELAALVNESRETGPTLVHCQAGLNRSALVAAAALVLRGAEPAAAVALQRERRSPAVLCNPVFEAFVLGLDLDDEEKT